MNLADYLQFLQPIQEQLNKFYSIASLAITVLLGIWIFNVIVGLIQRIYFIGKACGGIYRKYFHKYIRLSILSISNINTPKDSISSN